MADRLRAGLIGAGFMGGAHARAIRAVGGELSAVVASSPERSAVAARFLQAGAAAASARELVERDDVDVVHVCTPNALHPSAVRLALGCGKPVICEKPLATDAPTASSLAAEAHRVHVVTGVPFVYRFYPSIREIRARLACGARVRLAHGSYLQDWLELDDRSGWRLADAQGGVSRAFADIGIHWCDLVEFVTGHRINRLAARLSAVPRRAGAVANEDAAVVSFETEGGANGSLVVSQTAPGYKNALQLSISTDEESYAFDQEHPDSLWLGGRDANRILHRGGRTESPAAAAYSVLPAGHPQGYQDCFDAFVADTYRAIGGEDVDGLPTFDDGARAMTVTETVLAAAGTDRWLEVGR